MLRAILRAVLLPLGVAVLILTLPLVVVLVTDNRIRQEQQLEQRVEDLAVAAELLDIDGIEQLLTDARLDGQEGLVLLRGEEVVLRRGEVQMPLITLARQAVDSTAIVIRDDGQRLRIAQAVRLSDGRRAALALAATIDRRALYARVAAVVATVTVLLLLAVLIGRRVSRELIEPVDALAEIATRMGEGDLKVRADLGRGPPEIRALAERLNDSSAALSALLESHRRLVADIAHELRTPLTGLRLRLETLELSGVPGHRVEPLIAEIDTLARLIGDLLLLARAEAGHVASTVFDSTAAAETAVTAWRERFAAVGADLRLRTDGRPLPVRGLPGVVTQALDNFLANALRVTGPGGEAHVEVAPVATMVEVRVVDRGPGLTPEQRTQAFERFWRAPDAVEDGGSGLGLAIVRALAETSGGTAELRPRGGGGTVAVLRLRRA